MTRPRDRAREALAAALDAKGCGSAAGSVRAGFENFWVAPALDALETLGRLVPDDDDEP